MARRRCRTLLATVESDNNVVIQVLKSPYGNEAAHCCAAVLSPQSQNSYAGFPVCVGLGVGSRTVLDLV